jgi:hypothetical protein
MRRQAQLKSRRDFKIKPVMLNCWASTRALFVETASLAQLNFLTDKVTACITTRTRLTFGYG